MKITGMRSRRVTGTFEYEGEFREERQARPIDLYESMVTSTGGLPAMPKVGDGRYRIEAIFLEIDTDDGITGRAGTISADTARTVHQFAPLLIGQDPFSTELLWDAMYRAVPQARKGPGMLAISAIDNALWDAKGKRVDAPVWRLLGGPTRTEIPLYASMLGYSLEPALVRQRVQEYVARGFRGLKWFFRYGPQHGREGMARNLELVRTVRDAAGPDVNIMFDAWKSWDVPYALAMAQRMQEFDVTWLEEPVQPDRISGYTAIRASSPIAIAGGEQEYTRWGAQALIEANAVDYLQPDVFNAGGISELAKIATLASVNNIKVMPHARANVSAHLVAALSPDVCPFQEDLVKSSVTNEFFLQHPPVRTSGSMQLPTEPGLNMELDPSKIEGDEVLQV